MTFQENLKKELSDKHITISELSEKTGININTLNKYRPGSDVKPSLENAQKIAEALDVSLTYLVLGKDGKEDISDEMKKYQINNCLQYLDSEEINIVLSLVSFLAKKNKHSKS